MKRILIFISCLFIVSNLHAEAILTDLKGGNIPFSSLKGKWVMINFWASWCQPCIDEIAELNTFYKQHKKKVALFAVNFDAVPIDMQLALIQQMGIRYPSLAKNPSTSLGLDTIRGVPATFVFDPEGHLHATLYGAQTLDSLKEAISNPA